MTPVELLTLLRGRGVVLWADGDRLRYKAPRGVLTQVLRERLAEFKEAILALLRQSTASAGLSHPDLHPISRDNPLPLSYAQHGLWLMAQTTAHPPFNHPLAFRIGGALDEATLERSLNEIVRRHEIFRTSCMVVDGKPAQVVSPRCTLTMPTIDLRDIAEDEREKELVRLATEEVQLPFDLTRSPLLRAKLMRLTDEDHVFILTTHTFTADGYSLGILLRELGQLYESLLRGKSLPLPEYPIQFADYAVWQRRMLQGEHLVSQLTYWKERLRDSPPMIQWPIESLAPTLRTYRGGTKYFSLSANLSESVRALSRREGVTVFTVLLAALKTLLYRVTGRGDLVVGTTTSNRNRSELEGLIGYFANNLLLRSQLSDFMTFRELVQKCHEGVADALAHQDLPFEKLLEELSEDPEISHIPVLQVVFVQHDHDAEEDFQLPGLTVKRFPVERGAASFDLYLRMADTGGRLSGSLEYSTEIFDAATIGRIQRHFETLLKCVAADAEQSIGSLPILAAAERDELIQKWNNARSKEASLKKTPAHESSKPLLRGPGPGIAPQTRLERIISSIWQEILELENIGIHDNFFDLGGRSIHVIQSHRRLERLLGLDLPIVNLFQYPTIHSLAKHLGRGRDEKPLPRQSANRADLLRASRERRIHAIGRRT